VDEVLLPERASRPQHHDRMDGLSPEAVGDPDDGRLLHVGVPEQRFLHLPRVDVVATTDDQILLPVEEVEVAVLGEPTGVPGVEPSAA